MKRFANLPNIVNIGSIELHPKVMPTDDDDDQVMLSHKLTAIRS